MDIESVSPNKKFMSGDFGESKISKDMELNKSMTIAPSDHDELTRKLESGVSNNNG